MLIKKNSRSHLLLHCLRVMGFSNLSSLFGVRLVMPKSIMDSSLVGKEDLVILGTLKYGYPFHCLTWIIGKGRE